VASSPASRRRCSYAKPTELPGYILALPKPSVHEGALNPEWVGVQALHRAEQTEHLETEARRLAARVLREWPQCWLGGVIELTVSDDDGMTLEREVWVSCRRCSLLV
jgi:hypothetical protein